jgi:hypothetical protein
MFDRNYFEPRHAIELAVVASGDSASMLNRSRGND